VKGLTKISKVFAFSAPFGKFSSILCRVADSAQNYARTESQNPDIPRHDQRKGGSTRGSRTDGSTSTGNDLRGLDVSSFSTSAADVAASKDSVGVVCRCAPKAGTLKLAVMD